MEPVRAAVNRGWIEAPPMVRRYAAVYPTMRRACSNPFLALPVDGGSPRVFAALEERMSERTQPLTGDLPVTSTKPPNRIIATFDGKSPQGAARMVRVRWLPEYGEFICEPTDDGRRREGADYYTSDKADALATAADMCGLRVPKAAT